MDKIAKKVNSSLAFVKRNLFACSEETNCTAYVSLVSYTSLSDLKNSLSLGLLSKRRKFHRLQIFNKSVHNNIALPIPPYYI